MAGGIVGTIVGQIAGQIVNQVLSQIMSQFGQQDVAGGLSNMFMNSMGGALKNAINTGPLPQFVKDAANQAVDNSIGENQQKCSSGCMQALEQNGYDKAMSDAAYSMVEQAAEDAKEGNGKGKGAANWLVALAGALSEIQAKFLNDAMKNMDTMKANAAKEGDSQEKAAEKRDEFLMAQSEYQANMQMFNMMANMTATSLKSLGEGLTAIARKQ